MVSKAVYTAEASEVAGGLASVDDEDDAEEGHDLSPQPPRDDADEWPDESDGIL